MGIGLNAQQIKLVIDALRKGKPMKFSELKKPHLPAQKGKIPKTIPTQSLTRYLHYLQLWGLVEQDKITKRWVWKQYTKRYTSETEYNQHLEHSKKLSPALALIPSRYITPGDPRLKKTGMLRSFCEEHLETGYPELNKKLTELKELRSDLEELRKIDIGQLLEKDLASMRGLKMDTTEIKNSFEHLIKFEPEAGILGFLSRFKYEKKQGRLEPELERYAVRIGINPGIFKKLVTNQTRLSKWLKVALEARNKIWEVYKVLLGEVGLIRLKIEMGTPLKGICRTCPNFTITKSE